MKTNNKNKHSARKKLFPAIAMLTTSAIMLSTATYAWFTMSKDVEVKGINLTATVPASLQISLGKVNTNTNVIDPPANTNESLDWNNIVQYSDTYENSGLLKPASSTDGNDIFYTENASAVGKTIATNAIFTQADASDNPQKATLKPKGTNVSVNDGYYIDIPVWFRTSEAGDDNVNLSVKADIKPYQNPNNGELYAAARVAILDADAGDNSTGVIKLSTSQYYADKKTGASNTTFSSCAVQAAGEYTGLNDTNNIYGDVQLVTQAGDGVQSPTSVATVAKKKSTDSINYGTMTKKLIRIWLEGEDTTCWNKNAGQDFTISLTFSTIES